MSEQPESKNVEGVVYENSRVRKCFVAQYLLPMAISTFVDFSKSKAKYSWLLIVCCALLIINFLTTKFYYGKRLLLISWSITFEGDSFFSFDFPQQQPSINEMDTFIFTTTIIVAALYWFVESLVIALITDFSFFIIFLAMFALQALTASIYLQGYNEASNKWAEVAKTVLLGNVDQFEDLPEQATIESVAADEK